MSSTQRTATTIGQQRQRVRQQQHGTSNSNSMNEPLLQFRSSGNAQSHPRPPPPHAFQMIRQQQPYTEDYNVDDDYNNNNVHHQFHRQQQQSDGGDRHLNDDHAMMMMTSRSTYNNATVDAAAAGAAEYGNAENDDTDDDDNDNDNDDVYYQQENEIHLQKLAMWGQPFCRRGHYCWWFLDTFFMAGILGFVVGGCGLGFLTATHWLRRQWIARIITTTVPSTSCTISATATITSFLFSSSVSSSFTTTATTILQGEEQPHQNMAAADVDISCLDSRWILLIITAMGGFLTAVTFCLFHPRTRSTATTGPSRLPMSIPVRTMFHDLNFPQRPRLHGPATTASCAAMVVVLASFWTLVSGAPLGPEQALGSMATMIAWLRIKLLPLRIGATATATTNNGGGANGSHERGQQEQEHQQQLQQLEWIRICTAAMVSSLLGNPLLGPIFVQELSSLVQILPSATTRTLEPLVRVEDESLETTRSGRQQRRHPLQQQQQYSNASVRVNNRGIIGPPVFLGPNHTTASQSLRQQQQQQQQRQPRSAQQQQLPLHDYMHGWVSQLVASIFAGMWMQVWFPEWLPYHALAPFPREQEQQQYDYSLHGGTITPTPWMLYWNTTGRNLVLAIPIGLVCGLLGTIAIGIMTSARWIRHTTCRSVLQRMTCSTTMTTPFCTTVMRTFLLVLFPTLAGLIHGCLTLNLVSPLHSNDTGSGSSGTMIMTLDGLSFIQRTWNQSAAAAGMTGDDKDHGNDDSTTFLYARHTLFILTLVQIVSMAISVGWGLVGGVIVPMLVAGLCMGLALVNDANDDDKFLHLPISLTVPCCMAAMVVSICPIPLSITLGMSSIFRFQTSSSDGNLKIMGPVIVACLTAWTVTGGTGLLSRCEEAQVESGRTSLSERTGGGEGEERTRLDQFSNGLSGYDEDNGDDDDEHTGGGLTSDATSSDDELLANVRLAIFGRI